MDFATNTAFVIFSAVSPLLIAFIKQSGFTRQVNALIALVCYIVVGVLGVLLSGESLTIENAVNLIAIATVVGSAAYGLVWNNIGANTDTSESLDARLTESTSIIK